MPKHAGEMRPAWPGMGERLMLRAVLGLAAAARGATRRLPCAAELRRRGPLTCWAGQIKGLRLNRRLRRSVGPNPAIATNASGR